jgi:hypothetical protein
MRARSACLTAAMVLAMTTPALAGGPALDDLAGILRDEFGFAERQVVGLVATSQSPEASDFSTYRFAGGASDPTLGEGAAPVTPVHLGVHFVAWDDPAAIPAFPGEGLGDSGRAGLHGVVGGQIQPLVPYVVAHAVFPGEIPTAEPMEHSVGYTFLFDVAGYDPWRPDPAFPLDPWSGATHAVSLAYGPGPWDLTIFELFDGEPAPVDVSGFAIVRGSTLVVGVDLASLTGIGPDSRFGFGYAGHVHDGRYGACEACPSRISTLPGFPRGALPPYTGGPVIEPGFDPSLEVAEVGAIAAADGRIWLSFHPVRPWDEAGFPGTHFSRFFQFGVAVPGDQAGAFFGLRDHDGELASFGSGPDGDLEAVFYAMSDGSIVARTNFTVEDSTDGIDVTFEGGYLQTRDGVLISITRRFEIPGDAIVEGDPLRHNGAHPVFDFVAREPVSPATTTSPTTTTAVTTARSTTAVPGPAVPGPGGTCGWCWAAGALAVGAVIAVLLRRRSRMRGVNSVDW